jgi:aquaporin Z
MTDSSTPSPQTPSSGSGGPAATTAQADGTPNFWIDPRSTAFDARRLFAELVGTFLLTLVAAGGDVIGSATGVPISLSARVVGPGLLVMAMIYTLGDVSGAHLNPVVTLAFAVRHDFPWRRVPWYWLGQFAGAVLAAVFLRALLGNVGHLGASQPSPRYGDVPAMVMEIVLTCLLVTVILGTARGTRLIGHNAALAVGGTIALAGLFAWPLSGASMNPARSFGPALVNGNLSSVWVYFVGPTIGALLACGIAWILHGHTTPEAVKAATGSGE